MLQFIGLGNCGSRITKMIDRKFKDSVLYSPSLYLNFDQIDMEELSDVPKKFKLLVEGSGTGRSPKKGESFAQKHKKQIKEFLELRADKDKHLILIFGSGGGSGSGLAPVVSQVLASLKRKHGFALTFPDSTSNSDLNVNQNAVRTLDRMLNLDTGFKPFIFIDNDNLVQNIKHSDKNYWGEINTYIADTFLSMIDLFEVTGRKSSEKGISNIDLGELKRVFSTEGLMDIRYMIIPEQSCQRPDFENEFKRMLDKESLCGNYVLKDTLSYACGVIANDNFPNITLFQKMFNIVANETPGSAIRLQGNVFKDQVQDDFYTPQHIPVLKFVMIGSGYKLPKNINNKIKKIEKEAAKFKKTRDKESKVSLTQDKMNLFDSDDFDI